MLGLRRIVGRSAQNLRSSPRARATYSTGTHGKEGDQVKHFAGTSTEHGHHHAGPANESLGTQFFVVLAIVPACLALYAASRPGKDGKPAGLTRVIDSYAHYRDKWATRNALHTKAVEDAGHDRNLFISSKPSTHVDLKFPEIFNSGAPHNLIAGQTANLDHLVAHYEKINADKEEAKLKRLEERK